MQYCQRKRRGKKHCCTAGLPKRELRHQAGKVMLNKYRARIVCAAVAREMDFRTSVRRSMLGAVWGRRGCEWFSGTYATLAQLLRSNTNVQVPYILPINFHTTTPIAVAKLAWKWARRGFALLHSGQWKQSVGISADTSARGGIWVSSSCETVSKHCR